VTTGVKYISALFALLAGAAEIVGQATVQVTITSEPAAVSGTKFGFMVGGGPQCNASPNEFSSPWTLQWKQGIECPVRWVSPAKFPNDVYYVFQRWQDSSAANANPAEIKVPTVNSTLTGIFQQAFQLTVDVQCTDGNKAVQCVRSGVVVSPGTISLSGFLPGVIQELSTAPPLSAYFAVNSSAQLTARANPGFTFLGWKDSTGQATNSPLTLPMKASNVVVAYFR